MDVLVNSFNFVVGLPQLERNNDFFQGVLSLDPWSRIISRNANMLLKPRRSLDVKVLDSHCLCGFSITLLVNTNIMPISFLRDTTRLYCVYHDSY